MKRPNAAGSVLQALEPVAKKLAEMEQRALAGQPTAVVQMGCELADSLREAGRRAIDLLLEQAARAEPTGGTCACGGQTHSEGFEPKSFIMRFGRVSVMRRRRECDACGSSELGFDKASIEAQSCSKTNLWCPYSTSSMPDNTSGKRGTSSRPTRTLYAHGSPRISARSTKAARWGSSSIWPRNDDGERVPS